MDINPFTSQTSAAAGTTPQAPARGRRGPRTPEVAERQRARQVETAAIRDYLEQIERHGSRRRRDNYERSLDRVEVKLSLPDLTAIERLSLIQRKRDLEKMLNEPEATDKTDGFIKHAAAYSARKGIEYSTWRQMGVQAQVLKQAGIRS